MAQTAPFTVVQYGTETNVDLERDDYSEIASEEAMLVENRSEFSDDTARELFEGRTVTQAVDLYYKVLDQMDKLGLTSADVDELQQEYEVKTIASNVLAFVYESVGDWFDRMAEGEGVDFDTPLMSALLRSADLDDVFQQLSGNLDTIELSNGKIVEFG